jgi:wobble nucleotide-excising tRNase
MAKDTETPFTWTGWALKEAANHATAVCTYLQNLSQAADVNDRFKVHTEFVHNQMQMFSDRAKAMSDAVAKANEFTRGKVHTEFVHNKMQMFSDRAKAMSDAVAKASENIGVFVSLLQRRKQFEDMVRNSPTSGAGGAETKRGGEGRGT